MPLKAIRYSMSRIADTICVLGKISTSLSYPRGGIKTEKPSILK
jgi:hypothetical protein